jgi:hypothetical protein
VPWLLQVTHIIETSSFFFADPLENLGVIFLCAGIDVGVESKLGLGVGDSALLLGVAT